MTSLHTERFAQPGSIHGDRVMRFHRDHALDQLEGRTVWSAVDTPGTTATRRLNLEADASVRELADRLDAAVGGESIDARFGAPERELCDRLAAIVADAVAPDDVVVLNDALTMLAASAARERGAHTVWLLGATRPGGRAGLYRATQVMGPFTALVDALVISDRGRAAALMPSTDVLTLAAGPDAELDWTVMLADVVEADRAQTVGGTYHVRPVIAAR